MTREDILRVMLTGHLGSAAAVFAAAEHLAGQEITHQAVACCSALHPNYARRTLYNLRDAGYLTIEHRPRGLILRTHLPANCPPLPLVLAAEPVPTGTADPRPASGGETPPSPPAPPPSHLPVGPVSPPSLSALVQSLATPDAPELPLPAPAADAPPNGHADPDPLLDAMLAELHQVPAYTDQITPSQFRTLSHCYRDTVDLVAECSVFATWLSQANDKSKDKRARSAARKLADLRAGKATWYEALRNHIERSPRRQGGAKTASHTATVAPRPAGPSEDDLDRAWSRVDTAQRGYFADLARVQLGKTIRRELQPAEILARAKIEAYHSLRRVKRL